MYKEYFGFSEDPFGITPDPRFFYENPVYREAHTKLAWGIGARRGVMTLVGAVGTGKTTVLRHLMAHSQPAVRCVLADYPPSSFDELLTFAGRELGLPDGEGRGRLDWIGSLKETLLRSHAENQVTVLLLDEAQHLSEETLEGVRLLSNLEIAGAKALQVVLAGQPELRAKLDQPALAPLKQRITLDCRLDRLSYGEIAAYLDHRLTVAGYRGPELFHPDAVEALGFYTGGVPRLVNVLCANALIATHRAGQRAVSADVVVESARALRVGAAVDFRPSRPSAADGPEASVASPALEPVWPDPPPTPSRRGGPRSRASAGPRRADAPDRPATRRLWVGVALGGLAGLLVGTVGVALLRSGDARVGSYDGLPAARPAPVLGAPNWAGRAGAPDPAAGTRPPGSPAGAAAEAVGGLSPAEGAGSPATSVMAAPADAEDARPAAADDASTGWAGSPVTAAVRVEDAVERRPAPPRSFQAVVLQRGATISGIAWNTFGAQMFLALDLLKELNPRIDNLNWVLAGQPLRLPRLDRAELVRRQRDGSYRVILNAFPNPADALALGEAVRASGYDVVVVPRRVADDLVLSRVEIAGLRDEAAAHRAWDAAHAAAWLPRATPAADGPPSARP